MKTNIKWNLNFTVSKLANFLAMVLAFVAAIVLGAPEIAIIIVPVALGATVNRQYQRRKLEEFKTEVSSESMGG